MSADDVAAAVARWQGRKRVGSTVRKGPAPRPATTRVFDHIRYEGDHWIWTGAKDEMIRVENGHRSSARRILWYRFYGAGLGGEPLYRMCGTPGCVRPQHMAR